MTVGVKVSWRRPLFHLPWATYVPIALVAVMGTLVTWRAFDAVTSWEKQGVRQAFRVAASDHVLMVQREIVQNLGVIQDIGSFVGASVQVERREFREFVGPALQRYTSITALQWIPRVSAAQRASFEADARRSFSRFRIIENTPAGDVVAARARPTHFPVLYVQPYRSNREALGLDLASLPATLQALQRVRDAGRMSATPRFRLTRNADMAYAFSVRLPVYYRIAADDAEAEDEQGDLVLGTLAARRTQLRGFAAGTFLAGEIIESALSNRSPSGIDMDVYDVTDEGRREFIYRHRSRIRAAAEYKLSRAPTAARTDGEWIQVINVTDRQWEVVCTPIPGFFQPDPWSGWATLAGGLPFTVLLTIYLSTLVGRATKIRSLVTERTMQLVAVNAELNSEIEERLRTEKELQRLNETLEHRVAIRTTEAERHVRELEQFAYVASHDLKAPLRGIANLASWLEEDLKDKLTDATREQLALLRDRVQRMNALIEGLLAYSRIGQKNQAPTLVDTGELLAEVIDSLSPPPGFTVEVASNMPTLRTDRLHLFQVFSNLIGNSVKHSGSERGQIRISARRWGRYFEFTVVDDGPGIAPEYHDKVFMMFQTLEVHDFGSNTGIGLALVKKIVEEHGGSVSLQSAVGRGAKFRFSWPESG